MQDRIATYPNRWVLTPVTGQANTYDLTRADEPVTVGTQLNKATLLPDAVASAIESATGASDVELPADALDAIATALGTIGLTNNAKIEVMSYSGTGSTGSRSTTFSFYPRVVFYIQDGGYIGDSRNVSTPVCTWQMWLYGPDAGYDITFTLNDTEKKLTRAYSGSSTAGSANKACVLMNTSGVTYYVIAIGVK